VEKVERGERGSHISISLFSCRSSILVELEFGDVGFCGVRKTGVRTRRKILGARREPTTNSTHMWHRAGIEPGPHWWDARALIPASHSCSFYLLFVIAVVSSCCITAKAPPTRIRIFLNPQLFLSGYGFHPHASSEFGMQRIRIFLLVWTGKFLNPQKKKVADSKISGYMWTEPKCGELNFTVLLILACCSYF